MYVDVNGHHLSFSLKRAINSQWLESFELNWTKTRQPPPRLCLLTFPELFSFLGSVLPLFLDDGQPGQVGPGLLRLPLAMELVVAFFWLLLLNLLSFGKTKKLLAMRLDCRRTFNMVEEKQPCENICSCSLQVKCFRYSWDWQVFHEWEDIMKHLEMYIYFLDTHLSLRDSSLGAFTSISATLLLFWDTRLGFSITISPSTPLLFLVWVQKVIHQTKLHYWHFLASSTQL